LLRQEPSLKLVALVGKQHAFQTQSIKGAIQTLVELIQFDLPETSISTYLIMSPVESSSRTLQGILRNPAENTEPLLHQVRHPYFTGYITLPSPLSTLPE